ncbi:MAG: aldo/keto reductase [Planctomycetota bacterium]|nr:aldo/keto reductase [Planctomycetota bacterium]
MKRVPLGSTGVDVSQLCLGTMMFGDRTDEAEAGRIVDLALGSGVDFFDTAAVYAGGKTEEILGRLLKGRRDRVFLATKVNVGNGSEYPAQIAASLEASLQRLQTDRVDLFLLHWARADMDPPAIMAELAKVVRAGKARFIGCCNFPAWTFAHFNAVATSIGAPKLINNQLPYNLIERGIEVEILPQAVAEKIAITCYRPLMAGVLAGKYIPGQPAPADARATTDERIPKWLAENAGGVTHLLNLAKAKGVPPSHVAIAWLKSRVGVTCPIIGVSKLAQLQDAIAAFSLELTADEQQALAASFATEVKEVSQFYGPLRRSYSLLKK